MEATDKFNGKSIGLILLAAGKSTRLGQPKQLLNYEGQTLLQHSLQVAQTSDAHPVVVVLGADAGLFEKEVTGHDVHVVVNSEWQEGMAFSIRCGIQELNRLNSAAEGAVVVVCDQPYVTPAIINRLIDVHQKTAKPLVSCMYADTVGTPTFFHKSMFPELLQLEGDGGAKGLLLKYAEELEIISFPEGQVDIDTEEDYEKLKRKG
jgi:molybdenum cofactor cytidylyltransferase